MYNNVDFLFVVLFVVLLFGKSNITQLSSTMSRLQNLPVQC
jgi:hypothetical protein